MDSRGVQDQLADEANKKSVSPGQRALAFVFLGLFLIPVVWVFARYGVPTPCNIFRVEAVRDVRKWMLAKPSGALAAALADPFLASVADARISKLSQKTCLDRLVALKRYGVENMAVR